jgi:hypothetical protein
MRAFGTRWGVVVLAALILFGWRGNAAHAHPPAPLPASTVRPVGVGIPRFAGASLPVGANAAPGMRVPIGFRPPEHVNWYNPLANGTARPAPGLARVPPYLTGVAPSALGFPGLGGFGPYPALPATLPATGYGGLGSFGPSVLLAATGYGGLSWYGFPGWYGFKSNGTTSASFNPLLGYLKGAGNDLAASALYGKAVRDGLPGPEANRERLERIAAGTHRRRVRATAPDRGRNRGDLQWPPPLTGLEFKDSRERLAKLVEDAVGPGELDNPVEAGKLEAMRTELARLNATLSRDIGKLSPAEYVEARRFLDRLEDAVQGLEDPRAVNYFNGNEIAHAKGK